MSPKFKPKTIVAAAEKKDCFKCYLVFVFDVTDGCINHKNDVNNDRQNDKYLKIIRSYY